MYVIVIFSVNFLYETTHERTANFGAVYDKIHPVTI